MAAPKGNQYAKGNPNSGRPLIYDEKRAELEAEEILKWAEKPDSLTMLDFYYQRKIPQETALEMAQKYEVFRRAKSIAQAAVGARREKGALIGDFDSALVRTSMANYDLEHRRMLKELKRDDLMEEAKALVLQEKGRMDIDKPGKPVK